MYVAGSYFGDSDVLADQNHEGRDGTAIVDSESVIYVITRRDLLSVMKHFKNTYSKEMNFIAKERRQHHKEAIEELKLQNQHIKNKLIKSYRHQLITQHAMNRLVKNKMTTGAKSNYEQPTDFNKMNTSKLGGNTTMRRGDTQKGHQSARQHSSSENESEGDIDYLSDFKNLEQEVIEKYSNSSSSSQITNSDSRSLSRQNSVPKVTQPPKLDLPNLKIQQTEPESKWTPLKKVD